MMRVNFIYQFTAPKKGAALKMTNIKDKASRKKRPVKVIQFGEGNFLRAFADYMIDIANESGAYDGNIAIVKPIEMGSLEMFCKQDCFYTVILRGKERGQTVNNSRIITSVDRVVSAVEEYDEFMELAHSDTLETVISNTTEAGIAFDPQDRFDMTPPSTYPGKLTKFLYERYRHFGGDEKRGLMILPVELIEDNGKKLKKCVTDYAFHWKLPKEFTNWLEKSCLFCSTLVDRIVTGYPKGEGEAEKNCEDLGYEDSLITIGEPFALWVIESDDIVRAEKMFDLPSAGLPVVFTDNMKPYRDRKVRILNGAHTSFVPAAFLAGRDIVRECMRDDIVRPFIDACIYKEIVPTVNLPREDVIKFADSVCERFDNPFIDHALISICLNSVSKWRARVLPSLIDYKKIYGKLPACLTMSFAALCEFYARGEDSANGFTGTRCSGEYKIIDDDKVIEFFKKHGKDDNLIIKFAENSDFWGEDLTQIEGFAEETGKWFELIRKDGTEAAMKAAAECAGK